MFLKVLDVKKYSVLLNCLFVDMFGQPTDYFFIRHLRNAPYINFLTIYACLLSPLAVTRDRRVWRHSRHPCSSERSVQLLLSKRLSFKLSLVCSACTAASECKLRKSQPACQHTLARCHGDDASDAWAHVPEMHTLLREG